MVKWLVMVLFCGIATPVHAQLRLGVAEVNITPPVGAPMAGYYYNREATGVHDPLHVEAMVFE